jgi:hypothetical protein
MLNKRKGYRIERKVRQFFEKNGWKVIRAGASLGEADLICFKKGKCVLLQIKSTKKKKFYYYEYIGQELEGFPFYLVVDFGYGKTRIMRPIRIVEPKDGQDLNDFMKDLNF